MVNQGSYVGSIGVVVSQNSSYDVSHRGGVFNVSYDTGGRERSHYGQSLDLIEPTKPPKNDARTLRSKIQKRIDAYKSVENPTPAVRAVIEELEEVMSL